MALIQDSRLNWQTSPVRTYNASHAGLRQAAVKIKAGFLIVEPQTLPLNLAGFYQRNASQS
ncbi:MAG: hypothetical protein PHV34_19775 [Verrucomicrobiae bacterium]|nr:hypothetical protein [Verrucomicrobiae bacterium]